MIQWFEKHYNVSFLIAVALSIIVYYISSISTFAPGVGGTGDWMATVYHLGIFFLLAAFSYFAIIRGKHKNYFPIIISLLILYACSDEFHQFFVPGRHASLGDAFLDTGGILMAFIIYLLALNYRE